MAASTSSTPGVGSRVNFVEGDGAPPISAVPQDGKVLENKPSFIFATAPRLGDDADSPLPLPVSPPNSARLPMPDSSKPGVGSRQSSPSFLRQISSSSEDEESGDEVYVKPKSDAKTVAKTAEPAKKRRPPSLLIEANPGLSDLAYAEFVASEEDNSGEEREKAKKPAPSAVGGASEKKATSEEIEDVLDDLLADYNSSTKQATSAPPSSTIGDSQSGKFDTSTTAQKAANSGAAPKENQPAPQSHQDTSAQSISTSTPKSPKPGTSKRNKRASATIGNAVPPATPTPSSITTPSSVATPSSSAWPPKLDNFTSIRRKETEVAIDGEQSPEPEKSTRPKKSPHSEKPDRTKRRSQRIPTLTLQPRYVLDTGERGVSARPQVTLEQCRALLQLLEAGCTEETRQDLLGALAEMTFELPKKSRAEVLERSWRCARALKDAQQLRQWAYRVLSRYGAAREVADADSSEEESGPAYTEAKQGYDGFVSELKGMIGRRQWNPAAKKIAEKQYDAQTRLMAMAWAIERINGLDDKLIGAAITALQKKLGVKLLVLAFFQSLACPGGANLRQAIDHTASAVLRGILAGDKRAAEDFREMVLDANTLVAGLKNALIKCVDELVRSCASQQPGSASPPPITTSAPVNAVISSTMATDIRPPVAADATILDIVMEMLSLEDQACTREVGRLPARSICYLIGMPEVDREAALRAVGSFPFDDAISYIHGVCQSTLTPLSCAALLKSSMPDAKGKRGSSLMHHLMVDGNVRIAQGYLNKLVESGVGKTELFELLQAVDNQGVTALEAAIRLGCDGNVADFISMVFLLPGLTEPEKLLLLEARRADKTPGLLGAAGDGSERLKESVYHYMKGLLKFDAKYVREVVAALSVPDREGNPPLRLALMNENAGVVHSMVRAICEDEDLLGPAEKIALLSGDTPAADNAVDYRETALTEYYRAVKAKYRQTFPQGQIPKESDPRSGKTIYFNNADNAFDKPVATQDEDHRRTRDEARASSQHAMMSKLPENEREALKQEGQRLMRAAQAKAVSAFHMALRKGKAQSVAAYIKAVTEYAAPDSQVSWTNFILANDASGNSALFNAMANDEAGAVEAYVDAVLASALPFTDKERLLLQHGEVIATTPPKKYSPLQVAMASLNYRAMQAYIAAVLRSSLKDDDKQQLLLAIGGNGKSARAMVAEFAQKAPQTHGKCLQTFDEMINASTLSLVHKKFLTQAYNAASAAKKS